MSAVWLHSWMPVLGGLAAVGSTALLLCRSGRGGRPRYVVVLCLAGVAVAGYELTELLTLPWAAHEQALFGLLLRGGSAVAATVTHMALCLIGAWGLWNLRAWGRLLAMAYLGFVLASFLVWGARGLTSGGEGLLLVVVCQMLVLPFVTFSLMYLHGGSRHFGVANKTAEKKTDWLY